ncbi:MAG: hypothetical protein HY776_01525 [Actinobacteria bacterium]|nr:hypothetical protein [Actinomycetota bacterium]
MEGAGLNIGLSELQIFYDKTINMNNLSTQENGCVVTASSEYSPNYRKECVIDGIYGAWDANEWASNGEKAGAWIQLNWPDDPQSINTIVLYDRSNPYDHITDAWLIITKQDSSIINKHIGQFPFGGASKELYLTKDEGTNISALQIFITDAAPSTLNVGLSEIQCYRDTSRW